MFNKILVIGLGLIGGSLAKAIKLNQLAVEVIGISRDPETSKTAKSLGMIDKIGADITSASIEAEVIVIASPLGTYKEIAKQISPKSKAIITDVGSLKAAVIPDIFNNLPKNLQGNFVPSHPIAGSEKSGVMAAEEKLFLGKKVIITPLKDNRQVDTKKIKELWEGVGAETIELTAEKHDEIYAKVSHLPQLLSFAIMSAYRENNWLPEKPSVEFKTFLRLSNSNPSIWKEIFNLNQQNIDKAFGSYLQELYGVTVELNNKQKGKTTDRKIAELYVPAILGKVLYQEAKDGDNLSFAGTGFKDFTSLRGYIKEIPSEYYAETNEMLTKISISMDKFRRFIQHDLIEYFEDQIVKGV